MIRYIVPNVPNDKRGGETSPALTFGLPFYAQDCPTTSLEGVAAMLSVPSEIAEIFRYVLRDDGLQLTSTSTPDDVPGWDSMNHIALVVEAECRFGVSFEADEIDSFHSVGDLIAAILAKQGG